MAKRYIRLSPEARQNFRIEKLAKTDQITLYRNILNIIGKRMTENTRATLTLTGYNADFGSEEGDIKLSKSRAEEVVLYLPVTWHKLFSPACRLYQHIQRNSATRSYTA